MVMRTYEDAREHVNPALVLGMLFHRTYSPCVEATSQRGRGVLSIWKNRLCAMVVKDGMNKLGRRVPMYLGNAMDAVTLLHSCPQCIVCLVPEP